MSVSLDGDCCRDHALFSDWPFLSHLFDEERQELVKILKQIEDAL